jgi:hypothetical protein
MVELLVALAVFSTVMAGISVVFVSSLRAWRTGQENRSVFQMARASAQFMERDITSAFGSVDKDELKTLVGGPQWLTFVGITENPPTWREIGSGYEIPHSDISRITYRLMRDPEQSDQFLLIRLVQLDVDDIGPDPIDLNQVTARAVEEWNAISLAANPAVQPDVQPDDFELAANILDMQLQYGVLRQDEELAELWDVDLESLWTMWLTLQDDPSLVGQFWNDMISWSPDWDSRNRPDRKLPDVIQVSLTVRAAAQMPTPETMRRVFTSRIFLPLGYRRPMPIALQ